MFGKKSVLHNSLLIAFLISFCFLVFSCASSKMEIQTNPSIPKPEYKKLAVLANIADIEKRRTAEKIFITSLAKKGIAADSCIEIFPSIKEYSDKEIKEIARVLNEREIQAVLIIDFDETINNFFSVNSPKEPPPVSGGGRSIYITVAEELMQTVSANYIVKVVDLATGENSFYATDCASALSGGVYTNWEALLHSIANKTIQTMLKNSIIKPVKKQ